MRRSKCRRASASAFACAASCAAGRGRSTASSASAASVSATWPAMASFRASRRPAGEGTPNMMTDSLADMLTRIRNANRIERPAVDMPATKLKIAVAQVLKEEGFLLDYRVGRIHSDEQGNKTFVPEQDLSKPHVLLRVYLNYGPEGERVIRHIERAS